eukprot:106355_1
MYETKEDCNYIRLDNITVKNTQKVSLFINEHHNHHNRSRKSTFHARNIRKMSTQMTEQYEKVNDATNVLLNVGHTLKRNIIASTFSWKYIILTLIYFIASMICLCISITNILSVYNMYTTISNRSTVIALLLIGVVLFIVAIFRIVKLFMFKYCQAKLMQTNLVCIFAPSKGIFLFFMSFVLAILGALGIWHVSEYPQFTSIHYHVWLSVLFIVIAIVSLVMSLVYLLKYCIIIRFVIYVWQRISFYMIIILVIYDIISDILAAVKVY